MKTIVFLLSLLITSNSWGATRVNSITAGGQREPSIAVTSTTPPNIFVAYINTSDTRIHLNKSSDGGAHWADLNTAGYPGVDPSLAADSAGRLYVALLSNGILFSRSEDQGQSFSPVIPLTQIKADRPWIKVGPAPQEPLYLTYAGFSFYKEAPCTAAGKAADIYFMKSIDHGSTWITPQHQPDGFKLTGPISSLNYRCSSGPIAIGPNGEIYILLNCVVYDLSTNCTTIKEHHVYLTRSDDGGDTFSYFQPVPNIDPFLTGYAATGMPNRRINMASIAAMPQPGINNNGIIGIVWPCDARSVSGSTRIGVDICFEITLNKGESFSGVKILNDDPPGYHFFPAITGDETGFHAIWMDSRNTVDTTIPPLWAAYRSDGVINWSANEMVSNAAAPGNDNNEEGDPLGFGDFLISLHAKRMV